MTYSLYIWSFIIGLYLVFLRWYYGPGRKLSESEIADFSGIVKKRILEKLSGDNFEAIRNFMIEDDGKEFLMVNLIRFNTSPINHPDSGQPISAPALILEYFKPLMKMYLSRAGHPVMTLPVVGGYLDSLNSDEAEKWDAVAIVRYRSRRDALLSSLANSQFDDIYKFKLASLSETFAIPTQIQSNVYLKPTKAVFLILLVVGLLAQLAAVALS